MTDDTNEFKVLGRYRLDATPFAVGGMGEVYEAIDPSLGRTVAVKIIHRQFAEDEKYRRRFKREARIVAKMSHPGIVRVYDFGANGTLWLAMELLQGLTYDRIRMPLPFEDVIKLAQDVASAIAYAHENGIVHCDIKPANIFHENDRDVIIDWGLGYAMGVQDDDPTARTKVRGVNGTPAYAAPEQTVGDPIAASDIYSFGVTLFELVTGRLPFRYRDRVRLANLHAHAPRPAVFGIRSSCPLWLDQLIQNCMDPNPQHRPSPVEVLSVLDKRETLAPSIDSTRFSIGVHESIKIDDDTLPSLLSRFDIDDTSGEFDYLIVNASCIDLVRTIQARIGTIVVCDPYADFAMLSRIAALPNTTITTEPLDITKIMEAMEGI